MTQFREVELDPRLVGLQWRMTRYGLVPLKQFLFYYEGFAEHNKEYEELYGSYIEIETRPLADTRVLQSGLSEEVREYICRYVGDFCGVFIGVEGKDRGDDIIDRPMAMLAVKTGIAFTPNDNTLCVPKAHCEHPDIKYRILAPVPAGFVIDPNTGEEIGVCLYRGKRSCRESFGYLAIS